MARLVKDNFAFPLLIGDNTDLKYITILHSTEDDYVPFEQARRLFEAAPEPRYLFGTNGSHLDSFDRQQAFFGSPESRFEKQRPVLSELKRILGLEADPAHFTGGSNS